MRGKNLVTWLDWRTRVFGLSWLQFLGISVEKRLPLNTYAAYFAPPPPLLERTGRPALCFYTRNFLLILLSLQPAIFIRWVQKLLRWLLACALFVPRWSLNNKQQQHNSVYCWSSRTSRTDKHTKNEKKTVAEDGESQAANVV